MDRNNTFNKHTNCICIGIVYGSVLSFFVTFSFLISCGTVAVLALNSHLDLPSGATAWEGAEPTANSTLLKPLLNKAAFGMMEVQWRRLLLTP